MARVLHLLDRDPDYQTQTAVAQLTTRGQTDITIRTIGRGGDFSTPMLALLHLRRHVADVEIIHAWGRMALSIAAVGTGRKLLYSPTRFPSRQDIRWLSAILGARDVQVICPTDTMRRVLVQRGVPIERCHMIRPGVEFAKVNRRRDSALRAKLGFSDSDVVLLATGESIREANHHAAVLACGVLHAFDPKYKLLIWGRGPMVESARRFSTKMLQTSFLSVATDVLGDQVTFESLLPAADFGIVTADKPVPTLPVAVCMAAGLPMVALASRTVSELLEDRHSALMVGKPTSRILARRILDLVEDTQLQWRISDTAKTEAFEYFSMVRFISQFKTVYEQFAAGKAIEVPTQAPGAGMRFQGAGF